MTLFEIRINREGNSYCRCYSFARNEAHAKCLFADAHGPSSEIVEITPVMRADEGFFITEIDDSGFGDRVDIYANAPR